MRNRVSGLKRRVGGLADLVNDHVTAYATYSKKTPLWKRWNQIKGKDANRLAHNGRKIGRRRLWQMRHEAKSRSPKQTGGSNA